jgi:hypothetical protein
MSHKTFAWLLLVDRLNTRDMLQRHWNTTDDTHCELCPLRAYEDRIHLFFQCNFSSRVWNYLQSFRKPFLMEVVIIVCRLIRNDKIFNQARPTFAKWKYKFIHDMSLLQHRIKQKHKAQLFSWIQSLP